MRERHDGKSQWIEVTMIGKEEVVSSFGPAMEEPEGEGSY
jgi:hypothetical protein